MPPTAALARVAALLARRDAIAVERMQAARALIERCPLPVMTAARVGEVCYFKVPFSSSRRDEIVSRAGRRGIPTYFLYSPPMNVVFRAWADPAHRLDTGAIDLWCRGILPIDPRYGREYLDIIQSLN